MSAALKGQRPRNPAAPTTAWTSTRSSRLCSRWSWRTWTCPRTSPALATARELAASASTRTRRRTRQPSCRLKLLLRPKQPLQTRTRRTQPAPSCRTTKAYCFARSPRTARSACPNCSRRQHRRPPCSRRWTRARPGWKQPRSAPQGRSGL